MKIWSVVVAGGAGTRYGALKQLEPLGHQRVLDWAVGAMMKACAGVIVVVPSPVLVDVVDTFGRRVLVVSGADSRAGSVRAGLAAVPDDVTHVLVHDAARPLTSADLVNRVVKALSAGADGVVPVVPVADTLRTVGGKPADRSEFVAVQTPQGFRIEILRSAHAEGGEATDDATLVSRMGGNVVHVEGDTRNMKITEPQDMKIAEALLKSRTEL